MAAAQKDFFAFQKKRIFSRKSILLLGKRLCLEGLGSKKTVSPRKKMVAKSCKNNRFLEKSLLLEGLGSANSLFPWKTNNDLFLSSHHSSIFVCSCLCLVFLGLWCAQPGSFGSTESPELRNTKKKTHMFLELWWLLKKMFLIFPGKRLFLEGLDLKSTLSPSKKSAVGKHKLENLSFT